MEDTRAMPMRNVAIVSDLGAGKTSLVEAILFGAGAISSLGSVAQGSTVSDFEPEELRHHCSVSTGIARFSWNHTDITLLDTPGALSLIGEPLSALRAVDAVIIVLAGATPIRTELMRLWARISELHLPCMFFVNGMDRDGTSTDGAMDVCRTQLHCQPTPMIVPVGPGLETGGVVDLLRQQVIRTGPDSAKVDCVAVPSHLESSVQASRKQLIETVAENQEALLDTYVQQGDLTTEELCSGLRAGIRTRNIYPMYAGSATCNVGVWSLLHAIAALLPSPDEGDHATPSSVTQPDTSEPRGEEKRSEQKPFSAFVFKTVIDPFVGRLSYCRLLSGSVHADSMAWNASRHVREKLGHFYTLFGKRHAVVGSAMAGEIIAIGKLRETQTGDTICHEQYPLCYPGIGLPKPVLSVAIEAKSKTDIDKVSLGLHKLIEEDPSLTVTLNTETKDMVLGGLGQLHIDVALEKLHRKFGADVVLHQPKIPYHETIQTTSQAQGKYKKQTGGHGQYGDCWLEVSPLPRGEGVTFENRIVGGVIPRNFIPAVEKGVREAMHEGVLSGYPVVDVCVAVYDGSFHPVDSSELSFKIAGAMAFKKAMETAHPVLLEPMMRMEIDIPTDAVGAVIGDVNARRGRIVSVSADDHAEQVTALVPLAELGTYATTLNNLTGGRGTYVMDVAHYENVPHELAAKIIERHNAERHHVASH